MNESSASGVRSVAPRCSNEFGAALGAWAAAAIICATFSLASAQTAQAGVNLWTGHGPEGGHVYGLAIDPGAAGTLYAGASDYIFKSADSGASWSLSIFP